MKTGVKFVEMTFLELIDKFPEAIDFFPPETRSMLLSDPKYLVRVSEDGRLEVGYKSDDWSIC